MSQWFRLRMVMCDEKDKDLQEQRCLEPKNWTPKGGRKRRTFGSAVDEGVSQLLRRISILNWIKVYDKEDLISDFIAGITLGLTIIPQSIAYAALAGLPSQYGLYSAFAGELKNKYKCDGNFSNSSFFSKLSCRFIIFKERKINHFHKSF